jgi:hypothetical protein
MTSTIFWEDGPGEISITQFRIAINAGESVWLILSNNGSTLITDLREAALPAVRFIRVNCRSAEHVSLRDARDDIVALRDAQHSRKIT